MTVRERVLAVLRGEKPDRLPWLADLSYHMVALKKDGLLPAKYDSEAGMQQYHRDLGIGYYLQGYEPFHTKESGVEVSSEQKGDAVATTIRTPVGTLRTVSQYSHASYSWGITEHLIKDIEDLKVYAYIKEHTTYTPNYDLAAQRRDLIGDNGVTLCYTPKSPLMDLVAIQAGVENVTYMLCDEPEEFAALLAQIEEKVDQACAIALESPAECIMIPENISSECVVPFYQDFMKGYHQKWTDRIRAAGKISFVHQDGTVRGLIRQLSYESRFDVIEAVTPLPVGDIAMEEAATMVSPDTVIWGGMPGGFFVESAISDADFEAHTAHMIRVMTEKPRFVLGVADQVVPGSSDRRLKKVREMVEELGSYK